MSTKLRLKMRNTGLQLEAANRLMRRKRMGLRTLSSAEFDDRSINGKPGNSIQQPVTMSETLDTEAQVPGTLENEPEAEVANQDMEGLIQCFLKCNPSPNDLQVHALACALGVDTEVLESCMYSMLGQQQDMSIQAGLRVWASTLSGSKVFALTDAEKVLDDDYDPQTTNVDHIMLNDSMPASKSTPMDSIQDALLTDGAPSGDDEDQSVIINDGQLLPPRF